jgi:hypothetical protein
MYKELPSGDISLEEFEQLALDRLRGGFAWESRFHFSFPQAFSLPNRHILINLKIVAACSAQGH